MQDVVSELVTNQLDIPYGEREIHKMMPHK
jgi:hypothetical protein